MGSARLRILIAKVGLDGHDRGAKVVARALRDAGFEVIYSGLHQSPEVIVSAAVQEDVDAIGLSTMGGAHMALVPALLEGLKANGASDISLFVGGIVPDADRAPLRELGVVHFFSPGSSTASIVEWIRANIRARGEAGGGVPV